MAVIVSSRARSCTNGGDHCSKADQPPDRLFGTPVSTQFKEAAALNETARKDLIAALLGFGVPWTFRMSIANARRLGMSAVNGESASSQRVCNTSTKDCR